MRYPFVLLDAGETILAPERTYGAAYADALAAEGQRVGALDAARAIGQAAAELGAQVPPGHDRFSFFPGGEAEFWRRFVSSAVGALGLALDERATGRLLERLRDWFACAEAWHVYPDVRPALAELRASGARLAVVSNWDSRLPRLLATLGLATYFDAVVVSHAERTEKPAPELFWRALERLGATRERAIHAGNLIDVDVEGARRAGIDAVLVDRQRQARGARDVIADLAALPQIARHGLPD